MSMWAASCSWGPQVAAVPQMALDLETTKPIRRPPVVSCNSLQRQWLHRCRLRTIDHPQKKNIAAAAAAATPMESPSVNASSQEHSQLRGADVLWALQRAAAEKANKGKKHKNNEKKSNYTEKSAVAALDKSRGREVRPLCIRSDWKTRLDDLEKRLQDLSHVHFQGLDHQW